MYICNVIIKELLTKTKGDIKMKATLKSVIEFVFRFNANFTKEDLYAEVECIDFLYNVEENDFLNEDEIVDLVFANLNKEYEFSVHLGEEDVEVKFDKYEFYLTYEAYEAFKQMFK